MDGEDCLYSGHTVSFAFLNLNEDDKNWRKKSTRRLRTISIANKYECGLMCAFSSIYLTFIETAANVL